MRQLFLLTLLTSGIAMGGHANAEIKKTPPDDVGQLHTQATEGDAIAQYRLGYMYMQGHYQGIGEDYVKAERWLRQSAAQGYPEAQNALASLYARQGDETRQLKWRRIAAEQGHATAMHLMGSYYHSGFGGVEKDKTEAIKWYRRAAVAGDHDSQVQLIRLLEEPSLDNPRGAKDREAARWERVLAEQGFIKHQKNMATRYMYGWGVYENAVMARMWLRIVSACKPRFVLSHPIEVQNEIVSYWRVDAAEDRGRISAEMTPAQLAESDALFNEWTQTHPCY